MPYQLSGGTNDFAKKAWYVDKRMQGHSESPFANEHN